MSHSTMRKLFAAALVAGMTATAIVLAAGPILEPERRERDDVRLQPLPSDEFLQCPTPACMAPCTFGVPPQVTCKSSNGSVSATTYFCCCCGGGGGANAYKPL